MHKSSFISLTLDTYFDKIFYINLPHDTARNKNMLNQFAKFGITNFLRIEAIQLQELPPISEYYNFIKTDMRYILGQVSCRASHIKCIQTAKENSYEKVLIFEDDIIFLEDPNQLLTQNYINLHNWDMLYFGGLVEPFFRNQIVCAHAYGVKNTLYDNIINMAVPSGMEIDNFYAKILQHMSYNYNQTGKYNIKTIQPFNKIGQDKIFKSNIQN